MCVLYYMHLKIEYLNERGRMPPGTEPPKLPN